MCYFKHFNCQVLQIFLMYSYWVDFLQYFGKRRSEIIVDKTQCSFVKCVNSIIQWPAMVHPSKHIHVESTLKHRWSSTFTNVASTLIFGWKWKLSRRMFIDFVSTLTKQHWNNIERIMSIQFRWPSVVLTLIFGWKCKFSSALLRRRENSTETTLSIAVLMFTRKWLKNKTKLGFQV